MCIYVREITNEEGNRLKYILTISQIGMGMMKFSFKPRE